MKVLLGAATLIAVMAVSGCNTVAGVGEDVSGTSRIVQGFFGGGRSY